jgi:hypothetical protein
MFRRIKGGSTQGNEKASPGDNPKKTPNWLGNLIRRASVLNLVAHLLHELLKFAVHQATGSGEEVGLSVLPDSGRSALVTLRR